MKNTNKKAKTKKTIEELAEIKEKPQSACFLINKRDLLKLIRTSAKFAFKFTESPLCCIKLEVRENMFYMYSTDGNRLIESKYEITNDGALKNVEIIVPYYLLTGLCFNVSNGEYVYVTITTESITIEDGANGTKYELKRGFKGFKYPDLEKLLRDYDYKENNYVIAFNKKYMECMKNLQVNERTNIVKMTLNKESNLSPMIFATDGTAIQQRALLMPIRIR